MLNKEGFTLVELLGVLVILSVIFILIIPAINQLIVGGKDTTYQKQINTILNATYDWSLKNPNYLPSSNRKIYITLSELQKSGFVDSNIIDPDTKEPFPNDLVISISNVGGNYKYTDEYSKQGGDYLYSVEVGLMASVQYRINKPTIVLEGIDEDSYTTKINLGDELTIPSYKATSKSGIDLSNRVVITTTYNDSFVDVVDTSKAGIYYVNYTVVDDEGYSNSIVRSIIITDLVPPEIIIPEDSTISSTVTTFDLMEGVSCTDNSNICNITTSGALNLGVKGKYVIIYQAKDDSGNTTSKKRIITIE